MIICHARVDGRITECDHPTYPGTSTRNILWVNCCTCLANLTERIVTGYEVPVGAFIAPAERARV